MSDMNKDVEDIVRRCYVYVEGMQKRAVCSAVVHRHIMALLTECAERKFSLEDIQVCLDSAVQSVLKHKADET